jgi:hypothetical protein
MEKMIRKASVAMVERDTLEVRLHDLLQEVEVLRERERERERGVGGEKDAGRRRLWIWSSLSPAVLRNQSYHRSPNPSW